MSGAKEPACKFGNPYIIFETAVGIFRVNVDRPGARRVTGYDFSRTERAKKILGFSPNTVHLSNIECEWNLSCSSAVGAKEVSPARKRWEYSHNENIERRRRDSLHQL